MPQERRSFQAEVSRLLDIVTHSLYSDKEIFLRELISNASDACDRLRYLALTEPGLAADDPEYRVVVTPDSSARTLTVTDNGVGMSRQELIDNLGTIARSGTAAFVQDIAGGAARPAAGAPDESEGEDMGELGDAETGRTPGKDLAMIGQFGVGFYSAFMVADEVEVVSRKAGQSEAWRWVSDGRGEFTIEPAERAGRGTTIVLHLRPSETEFTQPYRLRQIIKKYSDHIALPILLTESGKELRVNDAAALWMRPRSEITAEQYREFYHHVGHSGDDPWLTLHARTEGKLEYASLLFVPSTRPFDLFDPQRKHRVKLYVRRVFITDDCPELLPSYLRFLKGIVDSEDLPLNVSREMLQNNPILGRMRGQITKRVLSELARKAGDGEAREEYGRFWDNFGAVLKEGLYEDGEQRDALLGLARFRSTASEGLVSLDEYVGRMKPGQEAIYTITGDNLEALKKSPQLEGFRAKGVEVLLLTDPVDEFWMPAVARYKDHAFKSVTRGGADLSKIAAEDAKPEPEAAAKPGSNAQSLIAIFKLALGDAVKDVRASERLTDSAVCLVADEGDLDMHLERLLKQHRQLDQAAKRILEINPRHKLIERLSGLVGKDGAVGELNEFAWLLLDQARILEGEQLPDPTAFARRLASLLEKGLDERVAA